MRRIVTAVICGGMSLVGLGLPVVGSLGLAAGALADVKSVPARWVVVDKDGAHLKCSDANIYYPVAILSKGTMLKVDGEGGGWLRAVYPEGLNAYVKAEEGLFDEAAKTVKLSKASKLMAANASGTTPWWYLLENDLPAGTVFQNASAVKAADGSVQGFLVPAPGASRGYIRTELTRKPTDEELAKVQPPAPKPAETPSESTPAPKPSDTAAKPAETTPAPASTEIVKVDSGPVGGTPQTTPSPAGTTTTTTIVTQSKRVSPEVTKRIDDIAVLRDMFDRVLASADNESEVQTVISEFNRKIDALGTTGEDGRIRRALEDRRGALYLKQEIIETRRRISDPGNVDERLKQIRIAMESIEKQAIYTIVGRMLPSTVYDGKRGMPLMYRIESADISSTRTVGYVVPREGVDLLTKLGKVVGIVGDARFDGALNLNIVAPLRVDELRIVGGKFEVVPGSTSAVPGATPPATPAEGTQTPPAPSTPAQTPAASNPADMNK